MPSSLAATLLLGSALVLALAFHRNRAAQVFATLLFVALALGQPDMRLQYGAMRFGPWLVVASCLVPEPKLLSRRNGVFVLLLLVFTALSIYAPEHVFQGLAGVSAWLTFGRPGPIAAASLTTIAAALCTLRWALARRPMELGLALALLPAAFAFVESDPARRDAAWIACGVLGVVTVLYASYRMAFIDGLSGLPNRRALDETLLRLSGTYALAMVDIDHFKQFNDTYGHSAGDIVLRQVARTLRRQGGGSAFRYGGEEFCVVFEGHRAAQAAKNCDRARAAVQQQKIAVPAQAKRAPREPRSAREGTKEVAVTISIGCAQRAGERKSPWEVLKAADQALYRAKAKGRNRVVSA